MDVLTGPPLVETKLRPPDRRAGLVSRPDLVARARRGRSTATA